MKVLKSIGLFFLLPLGMFLIGAFSALLVENYFYPKKEEPEAAKHVAVEEKQVLTSDTKYVMIETDLLKESSTEEILKVPEHYIGMDRERFMEAMENYELSPPLEEQNKGFVGLEVKSFSAEKVVVRKNYFYMENPEHFYLTVQDNYVVVMREDLTTVYMNTTIPVASLPDRIQSEIMLNKYIENEKELYDFLETYSS